MRLHCAAMVCLLGLLPATPSGAAQIYKCVGANGQVAFQDTPCARRQHQQILHDSSSGAAVATPPPVATVDDGPPTASSAAPPPRQAAVAVTLLYRCVRATDGDTYVSDNGHPAPYLVPLGIIGGAGQMPLAQVYGGADAARVGISAPELAPHASPALIGSNYTQVRDRCWLLDAEQTCAALQQQYDDNDAKLDNAFDSDKPPLRKREAQLQRRMAGCQNP